MIRAPLRLAFSSADEHPRVVGAGVLPDDHDQLAAVDVVEADRALADADRLGERHRGGLVAHVRAVGEVVGAVGTRQQLVGERGLVGGLARGVEDGLVGRGERGEVTADEVERLVPGDRLVVRGPVAQHHRLGDPALLAQPVLGSPGQVLEGVPREEGAVEVALRRLLGHGLGAVLAELRGVPVLRVGIRPCAALAVEPVGLVELQQGPRGSGDPHLLDRPLHGDGDAGHPRRRARPRLHLEVVLVDVPARCVASHESHPCAVPETAPHVHSPLGAVQRTTTRDTGATSPGASPSARRTARFTGRT